MSMNAYALLDPEDQFTGRVVEFEEEPTLCPDKGRWVRYFTAEPDPATQVLDPPALSLDGQSLLHLPRAKSVEEIAAMRAAKVGAVKGEASRRILAVYPDWMQRNLTARGVELTHVRLERPWTQAEQAEADGLQAAWNAIKAVRAKSNQLEATIPHDAAGIAAFDPTQGWE